METNVKAYLQKIQAEFGMSNIVFHHEEPEWLVHNGKPTEIMIQKMCLAFNFPAVAKFKASTDRFDELFYMFETEFNHMSLHEQQNYIENINSIFLQTIKELNSGAELKNLPDSIVRFQFELFRWSSFWSNIVEWRMTGKHPAFGLDLENINRFCANYLTPEKAVRFLQGELKRTITNYKFGSAELIKYKTELKSMLEEFRLLLTNRDKADKLYREEGITLTENVELLVPETNPDIYQNDEKKKKLLKPYLTTNEVLSLLGIKKTTFYSMIKSGKIKISLKLGRKNLIRTEEILNLIEKS